MKKLAEKKTRLIYLDIIRTLAVLCVFVVHFTRQFEYAGISYGKFKILPDSMFGMYTGSVGVSLFFIVSGASLMYVYKEKCQLISYFKKRFWGIFPMYWMTFSLVYLLNFFIQKEFVFYAKKWTILLTVIGMDGYLGWFFHSFYILGEWFLGCIILLYIIFPILRIGVLKKPIITAILALIVYGVGSYFFKSVMPTDTLFILRVPEFLFGMYFMCYWKKVKPYIAAIALVFLIVVEVINPTTIPTIWMAPEVGIALFLVITFISDYIDVKPVHSICITIGKYCFAIFLVHHIVIQKVVYSFMGIRNALRPSEIVMLFMVCAIVTAFFSYIVYQLNDKICKVIRGWFKKSE